MSKPNSDYSVTVSGTMLSEQVEKIDAIGALLNRLAEAEDDDGLRFLVESLSSIASTLHEVNEPPYLTAMRERQRQQDAAKPQGDINA